MEKRKNNKHEKMFVENVEKYIKPMLSNFEIRIGENLVYRVISTDNKKYTPENITNPKKVLYSFQTDILILENNIPLVIIEAKVSLTPHNVIVYSSKAKKHKILYPYLRYGLLLKTESNLSNFFYNHNENFDFAFSINNVNNIDKINEFVKIIEDQIRSAKELLQVFIDRRNKTYSFNSVVTIK